MNSCLLQRFPGFLTALLVAAVCAGSSGCKSVYYSTYEEFGVYKRHLLKKSVVAARDEQQEAGKQFKDALTRLKELYAYDGGDLERQYRSLQADYDGSVSQASVVRKRIRDMESVATDLFAEWEKEIGEISTPSLASSSRQKLAETRNRYEAMHAVLQKAEQSMDPVLKQFRDHVLYLKHNLNAAAIASLKGEGSSIQNEITRLLAQMTASVAKADEFVKSLE